MYELAKGSLAAWDAMSDAERQFAWEAEQATLTDAERYQAWNEEASRTTTKASRASTGGGATRTARRPATRCNEELADIPDDLFAPYAADDPDVTPLGRLLYGVKEPTPASEEDQPDPP